LAESWSNAYWGDVQNSSKVVWSCEKINMIEWKVNQIDNSSTKRNGGGSLKKTPGETISPLQSTVL
jgi:hypothetical protein